MARTPRGWAKGPNKDNTARNYTLDYQEFAYAATIALTIGTVGANENHIYVAQLTGALTINFTSTGALDGDKYFFYFTTDGTQRVVTFGTKINSSGTITIPASKGAVAMGIYDSATDSIRIIGREIHA